MIDKPGIYKLNDEEYHADPCEAPSLSRGIIHTLITSTPAHARFQHPRLNPLWAPEEKTLFDLGKAAHALLLQGEGIAEVCDFPTWKSNKAKEAREEARLAGKVPLLIHQYEDTLLMVKSAREQIAASDLPVKDLLTEGDAELAYIWQEGEAWLRVKPDFISHKKVCDARKLVLDYKTTGETADPASFVKSAIGKAYDIQVSLYKRGIQAVEGGKPPRFVFMIQENYPPFLMSFICLDHATQEMGKQKVEIGKAIWEKCLYLNEWPGYSKRIATAECPTWAMSQWEDKSATLGVMEDE